MTTSKPRNYRDAGTGEFVTQNYAEKHKNTTVSEPRPQPKAPSPPPKKK